MYSVHKCLLLNVGGPYCDKQHILRIHSFEEETSAAAGCVIPSMNFAFSENLMVFFFFVFGEFVRRASNQLVVTNCDDNKNCANCT